MSARLGNRAVIASRLGKDALGREARKYLTPLPADLDSIQEDPKHPTGSVGVTLTAGQAEYVIHEPVAWDFLEFTPEWKKLATEADAVCFGTLAQRDPVSRKDHPRLSGRDPPGLRSRLRRQSAQALLYPRRS